MLKNQASFEQNRKLIYEVYINTDSDIEGQIPMKIEVELPRITRANSILQIEPINSCPEDDDEDEIEQALEISLSPKCQTSNSKRSKNLIDDQLPNHLKRRSRKAQSDAQIREFIKLNCDLCDTGELFDTFKQLQEHFADMHETRGYVVCCEKKIYRKDRILNHITNHLNPDAFKYVSFFYERTQKIPFV